VKISLVQALTAMPRVSPSAWRATPLGVRWLISARASVLVMTFTAAAFGGLLTIGDAAWSLTAWALCTAGLLLAHAANNQLNDLTDSIRGIDEGNYFRLRYGAHVLEDGLLSRRALILYMCVTGGLAALCGVYLVVTVSTGLIVPFLLGSLLLLFYTWPLKQWGLGELAVLLVWGPLMVGFLFVAGMIVVPAGLVAAAAVTSASLSRSGRSVMEEVSRYGWALVPVGFGMWVAHYLYHFLIGGLAIIPATQEYLVDLGVPLLRAPAWTLGPILPDSWLLPLELFFLELGLLVSLVVAHRIGQRESGPGLRAVRAALPWGVLAVALSVAGVWLLLQPMEMRGTIMGG